MSDTFQDCVGAVASGELSHPFEAACCVGRFLQIDRMIRTESTGQLEAMLWTADHNYSSSASAPGDSQCRNADRSRALDNHGVAPGNSRSLHSMDGGNEGAAGANHGFSRQIIG